MNFIKVLIFVAVVSNVCLKAKEIKPVFQIKAAACCSWSDPHGPLIPGCMSGC